VKCTLVLEAEPRHGCWQGLSLVLRDGLEGYPPPLVKVPYVKPQYHVNRTTRRVGEKDWDEVT
jgi:hypothetical protein